MLVIAGTITIDPDRKEAAIAAAVEMMRETNQEPGCVAYVFSSDLQDPAVVHLFERWESQEALDAHFATAHMARFQQAMGGLGVSNVAVEKYEVSSVGPVR